MRSLAGSNRRAEPGGLTIRLTKGGEPLRTAAVLNLEGGRPVAFRILAHVPEHLIVIGALPTRLCGGVRPAGALGTARDAPSPLVVDLGQFR
jgi:hypothetical protein